MSALEHEKLDIYHRAVLLAVNLGRLADAIPFTRRDLRDQLRRASASIPLNIAEGAGEFSPAEKGFFRIARRSGAECCAVLDIVSGSGTAVESCAHAKEQLREVIAMLTGMVKRVESRTR